VEVSVRGRDGPSKVRIGRLDPPVDFPPDATPTLLVTEPEVARLHAPLLPPFRRVLVARGEAAKSMEGLESLWGAFLDARLDRQSLVLAIGGGAVSDLAGFAASTWMRGIAFEYVPTTLLAMVDAAVGGKTAIDFRGRKNLVGSFCQPRRVLCDVAFLESLPDVQFASGMGEVVKHALISGGDYLAFVEGLRGRRPSASSAPGREELEELVRGSIACKAEIVNRDEREKDERRILNLGHTIGHALESTLDIPHGHAIAAGLVSACRLADRHGGTEAGLTARVEALLEAWGLPTSIAAATALSARGRGTGGSRIRREIAESISADKKRSGEDIGFAMPRAPRVVEIVRIPLTDIEDFLGGAP